MNEAPRHIFLTTALPYANGRFHIGHMMEYIQADIWKRAMQMQGHCVHWVCADDAHGAPIMIAAEKAGKTPKAFVREIAATRPRYLEGFAISIDHWHSTDSPENVELAQAIYRALREAGLIATRTIEQFFDPVKGMFLPDRYVRGICPRCGARDQYGDSCEVCGAVYNPTELGEPYSVLSGARPELRRSEHFFFRLSDPRATAFLRDWTAGANPRGEPRLQPEVLAKVREWLEEGKLADWDISRDAPYFGIPIPEAPGKFFYVWLDAPIGYLAALKAYFDSGKAQARGEPRSFEAFLADPRTEQIHFIGKDIVYFHVLFWPALLHFAGRKTPDQVCVHGFIQLRGEKMSKSRGTGLDPLAYLELGMNPDWLRYYIAAKLNANVEDFDFTAEDFIARVNADLVGKFVNLASRAAGFIEKRFGGRLAMRFDAQGEAMLDALAAAHGDIAALFTAREFGKAIRRIMELADLANQYVDRRAPWVLAKDPSRLGELHEVATTSLEAFRRLTLWLAPVLPGVTRAAERLLGVPLDRWDRIAEPLPPGHPIAPYEHLLKRVEEKQLDALLGVAAEVPSGTPEPSAPPSKAPETITIEEFARIDLRIARILAAQRVEGSNKLLRLTLDLGETDAEGRPRHRSVFAGIQACYEPEQLVGQLTVVVANLAPRKMKFGVSEGMVLAASDPTHKQTGLYLLAPHPGAQPGMKVS
ncbi:MAG: methionine--tRNA ligase [Casimicrobiaceae bacterium]|nr:methionine--tRNA ligase [Casimicrobiaceae bacterium]